MSDMKMKTRENDFDGMNMRARLQKGKYDYDGNEQEGKMTERQVIDKLSPIFFLVTDVDRFFRTTTYGVR